MQALEQSNRLVEIAMKHQPSCIIKPHLYRIALSEANVKQLQDAAIKYPQIATWMSKEQIYALFGAKTMGGLKLGGGCQVIDVPSYLKGLWEACEATANECNCSISWEQREIIGDCLNAQVLKNDHDVVILAAGAGIMHDKMLPDGDDDNVLPIQLVRGQAIVMDLPRENDAALCNEALLCGKYVSPLPSNKSENDENTESIARQFVIGATHEFQSIKLDQSQVIEELRKRTYSFVPLLWDRGVVKRITAGVRMQSNRGKYGRMPIIGRLESSRENDQFDTWIFAGLSSRGLIYHGMFGRWLADAVLRNDETLLRQHFEEFDWWKQKK
jgi:glycine/D-amino acid oxidase-like deaminating enzyme